MKEMIIRALRTFIQAALGYAATEIVLIVSNAQNDVNIIKDALLGLAISAVAAGISAVMNMPKKEKSKQNEELPPEDGEKQE